MTNVTFIGGRTMSRTLTCGNSAIVAERTDIKGLTVIDSRHRGKQRWRQGMTGVTNIAGIRMGYALAMTFETHAWSHLVVIHGYAIEETKYHQWRLVTGFAHIRS